MSCLLPYQKAYLPSLAYFIHQDGKLCLCLADTALKERGTLKWDQSFALQAFPGFSNVYCWEITPQSSLGVLTHKHTAGTWLSQLLLAGCSGQGQREERASQSWAKHRAWEQDLKCGHCRLASHRPSCDCLWPTTTVVAPCLLRGKANALALRGSGHGPTPHLGVKCWRTGTNGIQTRGTQGDKLLAESSYLQSDDRQVQSTRTL